LDIAGRFRRIGSAGQEALRKGRQAMLHEFIASKRVEIIARTKTKVKARNRRP
jgi:hypothetical protein